MSAAKAVAHARQGSRDPFACLGGAKHESNDERTDGQPSKDARQKTCLDDSAAEAAQKSGGQVRNAGRRSSPGR